MTLGETNLICNGLESRHQLRHRDLAVTVACGWSPFKHTNTQTQAKIKKFSRNSLFAHFAHLGFGPLKLGLRSTHTKTTEQRHSVVQLKKKTTREKSSSYSYHVVSIHHCYDTGRCSYDVIGVTSGPFGPRFTVYTSTPEAKNDENSLHQLS